jgi:hypothetical protein
MLVEGFGCCSEENISLTLTHETADGSHPMNRWYDAHDESG